MRQLESEKCPHCGTAYWLGHTADGRVDFELEWRVCYGCAVKGEQTKGKEAKPGEYPIVKTVLAEGEDRLPSRSEGLDNIAIPLHVGGDGNGAPRNELGSIGG